jgi:2'-5' RNA ligase
MARVRRNGTIVKRRTNSRKNANYLIEFRFQSKRVKKYLKDIIHEINRKFKVGKRRNVPHITLAGPLTTKNEMKLISDFARVCSKTEIMKFKLKGFNTFDSNRVVFVDIGASEKFNEFRVKLANAIKSYCKLKSLDKRKDKEIFGYHSTLAMNLSPDKFKKIKSYINRKRKPNFNQIVMRVTLLKNGRILREYDFLQRRLLNGRQSLDKGILRISRRLLRQYLQGNYNPKRSKRRNKGAKRPRYVRKKSLISRIKDFFGL